MGKGIGYGKVILFGEHFTVYRNPCIASGLSKFLEAEVVDSTNPGFNITDNRDAADGYKDKYRLRMEQSVKNMNDAVWGLDFDKTPVDVTLTGDLYCASGVGASAASCVAMARAVSDHFDLGLNDEEINKCGFEGDKAYAATPSGIDNTCSTYGKLIYFIKADITEDGQVIEPAYVEHLEIPEPLQILMVSTGAMTATADAIEVLKQWKNRNPERSKVVFDEARQIADTAKQALVEGDNIKIGQLMNRNHELLQEGRVSHTKLDFLVQLTRDNGALGSKMTGGGMGGYMVALFPDVEIRDKAALACAAEGYKIITASVG
ncbi:MAG: mevalonate kinase [Thermoplasmata archaeon]|nr:mevalonate kinase [Thermoplasmata archaeon]